MELEREVPAVHQVHAGILDDTLERLRTRRHKDRVVLAPHGKHRRLVRPQICVECGVESYILVIVHKEVDLDGVVARSVEQGLVKCIRLRRDQLGVTFACEILNSVSYFGCLLG